MQVIAILVLLTTVLVPFIQVLCLLYILFPLNFQRLFRELPRVFRFVNSVGPRGMMEVLVVGILVSLDKLAGMARIEYKDIDRRISICAVFV